MPSSLKSRLAARRSRNRCITSRADHASRGQHCATRQACKGATCRAPLRIEAADDDEEQQHQGDNDPIHPVHGLHGIYPFLLRRQVNEVQLRLIAAGGIENAVHREGL